MSIQSLQTQAHELTEKLIEKQARDILALYRSERESILSLLKTTYAEYLVNTDVSDYWVVMNQYKRLEKLKGEYAQQKQYQRYPPAGLGHLPAGPGLAHRSRGSIPHR